MNWFRTPLGRTLTGAGLVALLIGTILLAGPSVGLTRAWSNLIALCTLIVATGLFLLSQFRAARAAGQLEAALRAQGAAGRGGSSRPGEPSNEELRKSFEESLNLLRQSALGRGAIYKMPWFVIIGPPGSGKTTLLRESDLKFPYMTKGRAAIRGLHGTKNCDWWFSDKAVLLDTAGRWMSEVDDRDEWREFLDLLRKFRKRQPINGAIVAVSLDGVAFSSTAEFHKLADDVRNRIDELTRNLQSIFPVYLVFTKCDGLLGFVESFSGLSREQRKQIWGFTFPTEQPEGFDFATAFMQEFDTLHGGLGRRRLPQLMAEAMRRRRRLVFRLPQEFGNVRERLRQFIELIQTDNPYQEASAIRGCYFTSGTQERSALGNLLAEMAQKSGMAAEELEIPPAERKCYFVDDVFERVIFAESELATPTRAAVQRRRVLKWSTYGLAAVAMIGLLWASVARYSRVADLTNQIQSIVTQAADDQAPFDARIETLERIKELRGLADKRPLVQTKLEDLLLKSAGRWLMQPATEEIVRELGDRVDATAPPPETGLWARAKQLADRRSATQRGKEAAQQSLNGEDASWQADTLGAFAKAAAGEPEEQRKAAAKLLEDLLSQFPKDKRLWGSRSQRWHEVEQRFDEKLEQLRRLEESLIRDIGDDGGQMFAPAPSKVGPNQLHAKQFDTAATAMLPSTAVLGTNLDLGDGATEVATLDTLKSAMELNRRRLAEHAIAPDLAGSRTAVAERACETFMSRRRVEVELEWNKFLTGLTIDHTGVREGTGEALAGRFDPMREELKTLCRTYLAALEYAATLTNSSPPQNGLIEAVKQPLGAMLDELQTAVQGFKDVKDDLRRLLAALKTLSVAAETQKAIARQRWADELLPTQTEMLHTLRETEDHVVDLIVGEALELARKRLLSHYSLLRTRHGLLTTKFPFRTGKTEVAVGDFFDFLNDLQTLVDATDLLPKLFEQWTPATECPVPTLEPGMPLTVLIGNAGRLCRQFDLENRRLRLLLWLTGTNFDRALTLERPADEKPRELCAFRSRETGDRRVATNAELGVNDVGHLQLSVDSSPPLTVADLQPPVEDVACDDHGLPPSFWGLFRLCLKQSSVNALDDKFRPTNVNAGYKLFKLTLRNSNHVEIVELLIGDRQAEESQLFGDLEAFQLTFPLNPWR
ncbi:MAG: type VI secretion system membrane subunit TssM [Planctomycetes bacterium]|nr:type VI secretion system membrane subunit TssM [Planctomycetota bacterium]